jgi:hypothetical protein
LLAAFVLRELWLQQRIADLSTDLAVNLDDLEETTEEIQSELAALAALTDTVQQTENLCDVTELLADANQQLDAIGEDMDEVATILEPEPDVPPAATAAVAVLPAEQDRADQVFTIFAILVGIAGIAIAILLTMAVRVQQSVSSRRNPRA